MSTVGRAIRNVGSSTYPVTAISTHNFERVYSRYAGPTGVTGSRYHYGDMEFTSTGGGEYLRVRGIANTTSAATASTINAIHATGRVASGATVSGALNAVRATLEVAGTNPTPGGTLAALQLDGNIVTGATMGIASFIRVSKSGATDMPFFINFEDDQNAKGGTASSSDGIKIRWHDGTTKYIMVGT
jgi:hypothetical protein